MSATDGEDREPGLLSPGMDTESAKQLKLREGGVGPGCKRSNINDDSSSLARLRATTARSACMESSRSSNKPMRTMPQTGSRTSARHRLRSRAGRPECANCRTGAYASGRLSDLGSKDSPEREGSSTATKTSKHANPNSDVGRAGCSNCCGDGNDSECMKPSAGGGGAVYARLCKSDDNSV